MQDKNYSWGMDPKTGDYLRSATGDAVQDESLHVPILIRMKTPALGWLYAPSEDYGSTLFRNQKHNTTRGGGNNIENDIFTCLAPIRDDGRMVGMETSLTDKTRSGEGYLLKYQQNNGQIKKLDLEEILKG